MDFLETLHEELAKQKNNVPVFIGGKLNQVLTSSNSDLPVDVTNELINTGAIICKKVEDFYAPLTEM